VLLRRLRNQNLTGFLSGLRLNWRMPALRALALLWLVPVISLAQPAPVKCAQVLTSEQVRAAVGSTLKVLAIQKAEAGVTECSWSRSGGAAASGGPTIRVQFFERAAISTNPVVSSPDGYFEMIASAAEEIAGRKRESVTGLAGAGTRAVTVQGSEQVLVLVQRGDGIARVVLGNLTKGQAIAVARAISGP
jgi:hypothetical protein